MHSRILIGVTFTPDTNYGVSLSIARWLEPITLGNKISLFFLAHEGKYQILIELLTLNSNM